MARLRRSGLPRAGFRAAGRRLTTLRISAPRRIGRKNGRRCDRDGGEARWHGAHALPYFPTEGPARRSPRSPTHRQPRRICWPIHEAPPMTVVHTWLIHSDDSADAASPAHHRTETARGAAWADHGNRTAARHRWWLHKSSSILYLALSVRDVNRTALAPNVCSQGAHAVGISGSMVSFRTE
jgi:hypothetical protein